MARLLTLSICSLLTCGVAFSQAPVLQPRIILPADAVGTSFWLWAPVIAIIKVHAANWEGGGAIEVSQSPQLFAQLAKVEADVENVIQGTLAKGPVWFYFFTSTVPKFTTWFETNKRYVVFLRLEGNVMRTMSDITGAHFEILSGRHAELPHTSEPGADKAGEAIAFAALTPSEDHAAAFANSLGRTHSKVVHFAKPAFVARLLRNLLNNPGGEIRERACYTLSSAYQYRDPCLQAMEASPDSDRQRPIVRVRQKPTTERLVMLLRDDPTSLSIQGKTEDLASDLELFMFDWDPAVRWQARETLHRLFPLRSVPGY